MLRSPVCWLPNYANILKAMDEWRHIYGVFRLGNFQRKGSELLNGVKVK